MVTVFTTNGQKTTSTSHLNTATVTVVSDSNKSTSTSGLSKHDKIIVGCVVGIVTPFLIGLIGLIIFIYYKKNANVDHSGKEWNDDDDEDEVLDNPSSDIVNDMDETFSPESNNNNENKAVNF